MWRVRCWHWASWSPACRFATSYPGFAPNGGDALVELRTHLSSQGAALAGARVWADWGTQRVLPAYQDGAFGDPRWEAGSFRSLNRLVRFPPDSASAYPQPGEYVVIYSAEDRTCWHCRRALQPVAEAFGPLPGPGWEELFTSSAGNLTLYRLGPVGGLADPGCRGLPHVGCGDPHRWRHRRRRG